jgi:ArsR family transcriptional regulator, arsenate/arsenite/antimonite-responsive transcriptional repressor
MGGQRVLRDFEKAREFAGREPVRLVANQRPKGPQPGRLRKRGQSHQGLFIFHISRYIEMMPSTAGSDPRLYFEYSRNIVDRVTDGINFRGMKIDDAAARLEALGNPTRLRIYRALVRAGHSGMSVGKLQTRLELAASTLSHHLKALLTVGLISQERQATTLICRANYEVMRGIVDFLVAECCIEAGCTEPAKPVKVA